MYLQVQWIVIHIQTYAIWCVFIKITNFFIVGTKAEGVNFCSSSLFYRKKKADLRKTIAFDKVKSGQR